MGESAQDFAVTFKGETLNNDFRAFHPLRKTDVAAVSICPVNKVSMRDFGIFKGYLSSIMKLPTKSGAIAVAGKFMQMRRG